jgi:hypothetical protein
MVELCLQDFPYEVAAGMESNYPPLRNLRELNECEALLRLMKKVLTFTFPFLITQNRRISDYPRVIKKPSHFTQFLPILTRKNLISEPVVHNYGYILVIEGRN